MDEVDGWEEPDQCPDCGQWFTASHLDEYDGICRRCASYVRRVGCQLDVENIDDDGDDGDAAED